MLTIQSSDEPIKDVISNIRKVGTLDDAEAEIFVSLKEHGDYSFDRYVYPYFEEFWLNAKVGSTVSISVDSIGVVRNMRLVAR